MRPKHLLPKPSKDFLAMKAEHEVKRLPRGQEVRADYVYKCACGWTGMSVIAHWRGMRVQMRRDSQR